MTDPREAARRRSAAVQALEDLLNQQVDAAQRAIWEKLLVRLKDLHAAPAAQHTTLLAPLLQEITNTVLLPLARFYGQSLLYLPAHQLDYFAALDVAGYQKLRAPLAAFLTARLGVDAQGLPVAGGYLATIAGDTTVARQVLTYAYQAQASGVGLNAYRDGLNALVLGSGPGAPNGLGVVQALYKNSGEDFAQADRMLHSLAAKELGLAVFLYQGGLIDSSRPFCVARNGRVFLDVEIARFGTKTDKYGGYARKEEGYFSGKPDPYTPAVDLGGYRCRHFLHALPAVVALSMRDDLAEDAQGQLFVKS